MLFLVLVMRELGRIYPYHVPASSAVLYLAAFFPIHLHLASTSFSRRPKRLSLMPFYSYVYRSHRCTTTRVVSRLALDVTYVMLYESLAVQ